MRNWLDAWVEVLVLYFDFEVRASVILRLKFRGREAILSRAQSRNKPNFGREEIFGQNMSNFG